MYFAVEVLHNRLPIGKNYFRLHTLKISSVRLQNTLILWLLLEPVVTIQHFEKRKNVFSTASVRFF